MGTLAQANECTNPTSGDWFWIHDVSAGATDRDRRVDVGRFAQLAGATFTGAVSTTGLTATVGDAGTGSGAVLQAGANTNVTTPAPGALRCNKAVGGGATFLFPDDSNVWRYTTSAPTSATYAAASVVGAQTSSLDSKHLQGAPDVDGVWDRIAQGARAVRRFVYKSGAFNNEEFSGVVVDYAPHYGMDRDEEHPAGKALNEINVIGDLLLAVSQLHERVAAMEGE